VEYSCSGRVITFRVETSSYLRIYSHWEHVQYGPTTPKARTGLKASMAAHIIGDANGSGLMVRPESVAPLTSNFPSEMPETCAPKPRFYGA
jgi:hypothetical protein